MERFCSENDGKREEDQYENKDCVAHLSTLPLQKLMAALIPQRVYLTVSGCRGQAESGTQMFRRGAKRRRVPALSKRRPIPVWGWTEYNGGGDSSLDESHLDSRCHGSKFNTSEIDSRGKLATVDIPSIPLERMVTRVSVSIKERCHDSSRNIVDRERR